MPVAAASLSQQVQFLRRAAGVFHPLGDLQWGAYSYERATMIDVGGLPLWGRGGRLTVRASDLSRSLTTADRLRMDGDEFEITIRKAVAIDSDDIDLEVQSAPTAALYEAEMDRRGETVTLSRTTPTTPITAQARAIVTGYKPSELEGGISQGDQRVFLLASDVVAGNFPLPIKKAFDRLLFRGRDAVIQSVDDNTHRIAGVLMAFDIWIRG